MQIWPKKAASINGPRTLRTLAGFLNAWNFALWALITVSNIGILTATSLAYSLGPHYAWIANSNKVINTFNLVLFGIILIVCIIASRSSSGSRTSAPSP